ncbi:MAG: hypothetical protein IT499_11860 [Rubrivivax sp.]|nr:hypothetical protein [Rubrivivax sp.]
MATVPLGHDGEPCGAVCFERAPASQASQAIETITAADLAAWQHLLRLALPALRWSTRRASPGRGARRAPGRAVQALRQPQRRRTRRLVAAAALALLFAAFAPLEHEVAGRAHRGRRAACARPLPGEQFFERLRRALPALAGV